MAKPSETFKRALEFLKAAENNLKIDDIKTVANREYFAAEAAIVAFLQKKFGKVPEEHANIWTYSKLLNLDIDTFSLLRELYDLRLQADYGKASEIVRLDRTTVEIYLQKVKNLIETINKKIEQSK